MDQPETVLSPQPVGNSTDDSQSAQQEQQWQRRTGLREGCGLLLLVLIQARRCGRILLLASFGRSRRALLCSFVALLPRGRTWRRRGRSRKILVALWQCWRLALRHQLAYATCLLRLI